MNYKNKNSRSIRVLFFILSSLSFIELKKCPIEESPVLSSDILPNYNDKAKAIVGSFGVYSQLQTEQLDLIYIYKQTGNQKIYNPNTSIINQSFNIANSDEIIQKDFEYTSRVYYILLDVKGNVYKVDGYDGTYTTYSNPQPQPQVQRASCLSIKHKMIFTWVGNQIQIITYTNKDSYITPFKQNLMPNENIQGCNFMNDKNTLLVYTLSNVYTLDLPTFKNFKTYYSYSFDALTISNFISTQNYILFYLTTSVSTNNKVIAILGGKKVFDLTTSDVIVGLQIDVDYKQLITTNKASTAKIYDVNVGSLIKTLTFLESPINYDNGIIRYTKSRIPYTQSDLVLQFIFTRIQVFSSSDKNNSQKNFVLFESDNFLFLYKRNTFDPIIFKAGDKISKWVVDVYRTDQYLVVIGSFQLSYYSLVDWSLQFINHISAIQVTQSDTITAYSYDENLERVVIFDGSYKLVYWNMKDLTHEKTVDQLTNQKRFIVDYVNNKLVVFANYGVSANDTDNFLFYVYSYRTGEFLFTGSYDKIVLDVLYDIKTGNFFFILKGGDMIMRQFNTNQLDNTNIFTYTLSSTATNYYYKLFISQNRIIIHTDKNLNIFNYNQSTALLSYTTTYTTINYFYNWEFKKYVVIQSSTNLNILSQDSSLQITLTITNDIKFILLDPQNSDQLVIASIGSNKIATISICKVTDLTVPSSNSVAIKYQVTFTGDIFDFQYDNDLKQYILLQTVGSIFVLDKDLTFLYSYTPYSLSTISSIYLDSEFKYLSISYADSVMIKCDYVQKIIYQFYKTDNKPALKIAPIYSKSNLLLILSKKVLIVDFHLKEIKRELQYTGTQIIDYKFDTETSNVYISGDAKFEKYDGVATFLKNYDNSAYGQINKISLYKRYVVLASKSKNTIILDKVTFNQIGVLVHQDNCSEIKICIADQSMQRIFTVCLNDQVYIWDLSQGKYDQYQILDLQQTTVYTINNILIYPTSQIILFSGVTAIYNYQDLSLIQTFQINTYAFIDETRQLLCEYNNAGTIWVRQLNTWSVLFQKQVHLFNINFLIIYFTDDTTVQLISAGSFLGTQYMLVSGLIDSDSKKLIAGDTQGEIFIYQLPSLTYIRSLKRHSTNIIGFYLFSEANSLLSFGYNGQVVTWDYYQIINLDVVAEQQDRYGLSLPVAKDDSQIYFADSQNVIQMWNNNNNQMKFINIFQIDKQFMSSTIMITNDKNNLILICPNKIMKFDLKANIVTNTLNQMCKFSQIFNKQWILCLDYYFQIKIFDTNLLTKGDFPMNSSYQYQFLDFIYMPQYLCVIMIFRSGRVIILTFNESQNTFLFSYDQIPIVTSATAVKYQNDVQRSALLIAFSDGNLYEFFYNDSAIINTNLVSNVSSSSKIIDLYIFGGYLYVRKAKSSNISAYKLPDYIQVQNKVSTENNLEVVLKTNNPCIGQDSYMVVSQESDLMVFSCIGQYNVYSYSTNKLIGINRQMFLDQRNYYVFQKKTKSNLMIINKTYFIDSLYTVIYIFKISRETGTVGVQKLGTYVNQKTIMGIIKLNYLFSGDTNDKENIYGVEIYTYSYESLGIVTIPFTQDSSTCELEVDSSIFQSTLLLIENTYSQVKSFASFSNFQLNVLMKSGVNMPFFPKFSFSEYSTVTIMPSSTATLNELKMVKVIGTDSFFTSASRYKNLILQNLDINLISSSTETSQKDFILSSQSNELQIVKFTNIQITRNTKQQQVYLGLLNQVVFQDVYTLNNIQPTDISQSRPYIVFQNILQIEITHFEANSSQYLDEGIIQISNPYYKDHSNYPAFQQSQVKLTNIILQSTNLRSSAQNSIGSSLFDISLVDQVSINQVTANLCSGDTSLNLVNGLFLIRACKKVDLKTVKFTSNNDMFLIKSSPTLNEVNPDVTNQIQKYYTVIGSIFNSDDITISSNNLNGKTNFILSISAEQITSNKFRFNQNTFKQQLNGDKIVGGILLIQDVVKESSITDIIANSNTNNQSNIVNIIDTQNLIINGFHASINKAILGVLSLSNSDSQLNDLQFAQSNGGSIYFSGSKSDISSSNFASDISSYPGGSINSYNSTISFKNVDFTECSSSDNGGAIFSDSSKITLQVSTFTSCSSQTNGGSIYVKAAISLNLNQVTITKSSSKIQGGAIFATDNSKVEIDSSFLTNNSAINGGALYIDNCNKGSYSKDTLYSNNKAKGSGGGTMIQSCDIDLQLNKYESNISGYGGAIRYLGFIPTVIKDYISSGRIKYQQKEYTKIANNLFKQNYAVIIGNEIASLPTAAKVSINDSNFKFITNIQESHFLQKERVLSAGKSQYTFENFRSGYKNFQFDIEYQDILGQKIEVNFMKASFKYPEGFELDDSIKDEIQTIRGQIVETKEENTTLENQMISIEGQANIEYQLDEKEINSGLFFNNIQITGVPGQQGEFCLHLKSLYKLDDSYNFVESQCTRFQVNFRECEIGEIYLTHCSNCLMNQCSICSNGTYSLTMPEKTLSQACLPCDYQVAKSCYGNQIELLPRFWRLNNLTDNIIFCDNELNSCNGDASKRYCKEGYTGPMCETCDNYGEIWNQRYGIQSFYSTDQCGVCSSMDPQISLQVVFIVLMSIYIFWQIYSSNTANVRYIKGTIMKQLGIVMLQNSIIKNELPILSKLLIHYLSIQELISQYKLRMEQMHQKLYSVPQQLLFPISNLYSGFDCWLSSPTNPAQDIPIEYQRLIMTFVQCAIMFVLIILFTLIMIKIYQKSKYSFVYIKYHFICRSAIINQGLFFFYFLQQSITTSALKILSCKQIGENFYILSQIDKECYTPEFIKWMFLVFPSFLLSAFGYPLTILFLLKKNLHKLNDPFSFSPFRRYGFLYSEFKRDFWWWEVFRLIFRSIITIVTQLSMIQLNSRGTIVLILLFLYLMFSQKVKPYKNQKLNRIDKTFTLFTIFMVVLSIFQYSLDSLPERNIISVIIFCLKLILIIKVVTKLLQSFLEKNVFSILQNQHLKKALKGCSKILCRDLFFKKDGYMRRSLPSLYILLHEQDIISIDQHFRWKSLQLLVFEFLRSRKSNPNAQFYDETLKFTNMAESFQKDRRCFSKQVVKAVMQVSSVGFRNTSSIQKQDKGIEETLPQTLRIIGNTFGNRTPQNNYETLISPQTNLASFNLLKNQLKEITPTQSDNNNTNAGTITQLLKQNQFIEVDERTVPEGRRQTFQGDYIKEQVSESYLFQKISENLQNAQPNLIKEMEIQTFKNNNYNKNEKNA